MKTGLVFGYPNKPVNKHYGYHGMNRSCPIQPDPGIFIGFPTIGGITNVITKRAYNQTTTTAICVGEIQLSGGAGNCTWRGFEFGLTEVYDKFVFEFGDFPAGEFELDISF